VALQLASDLIGMIFTLSKNDFLMVFLQRNVMNESKENLEFRDRIIQVGLQIFEDLIDLRKAEPILDILDVLILT